MANRGMITDELHPAMAAARADLAQAMFQAFVARGVPLDQEALDDAYGIIDAHRVAWLLRGVKFPRMRILAFPSIGQMEIVRADLDRKGIQVTLVNMTVKHPRLTADDIAAACAHAFPDYRPDPGPMERRATKIIQPGDVQWSA